jgi:hypothetical protein
MDAYRGDLLPDNPGYLIRRNERHDDFQFRPDRLDAQRPNRKPYETAVELPACFNEPLMSSLAVMIRNLTQNVIINTRAMSITTFTVYNYRESSRKQRAR